MIALKTWREIRLMALVYLIILELMLVPAVLLWPTLYEDLQRSTLLSSVPGFLQNMVNSMRDSNESLAFRSYMAVQMFFKGVNVAGIACGVLLGTAMIARERENQTLEFLLARPISRSRILWSKYWVTAVAVVIPIYVSSWSAIPLSNSIGWHLPFGAVTLGALHSSAFVLMFFTLTCLFSVVCRNQVHVAFIVGGLTIVQVCVYFIQTVRKASLFRLSDFDVYGPILAGDLRLGQLFWDKTAWILVVTILLYGTADRILARTDL